MMVNWPVALVAAGIASLTVALIMPYTTPEGYAELLSHPTIGLAINATVASVEPLARLLVGAPGPPRGPFLADHYPLPLPPPTPHPRISSSSKGRDAKRARAGPDAVELDWAHPDVWRLQQEALGGAPYYTPAQLERLLHWCGDGASSSSSSSSSTQSGAATEQGQEEQARYARLAAAVAASGGNVSRVTLGTDSRGVRGLHATEAIGEGQTVLSLPVRLGLSIAAFSAAKLAAGPTAPWAALEDGDLFLDALALSYEVAVRGPDSAWAAHVCTLPRAYALPLHVTSAGDAALIAELPSVRRLAAKRRAQAALFERLAADALLRLPGGRPAMQRLQASRDNSTSSSSSSTDGGGGGLWRALWHWSYGAAKTRSVTLSAEELQDQGSGGGGGGSGGGGGTAALGPPVRLPLAMKAWVQELGALLPVLDMANHAFGGEGANAAMELAPTGPGGRLEAVLTATSPIPRGGAVTFDYVAATEADSGPACADRWLNEYGFVPYSNDRRRDCDTLYVTPADVAAAAAAAAAATRGSAGPPVDAAQLAANVTARFAAAVERGGVPPYFQVIVRQPSADDEAAAAEGGGRAHWVQDRWAVLQWLGAGLRGPAPADTPSARAVLQALLEARAGRLREVEALARAAAVAGAAADAGAADLRRGVATVAAGAQRAVQGALEQERG